uniref:Growth arrest and DNA damage inducible gamma n=1 Tax=Seriola lalandi dorsalis TaxID=1841481 RepID=A0A3B4XYN8_SERLL
VTLELLIRGQDAERHTVRVTSPGKSLKEALLCAQSEDRLTVGVYESAKIMTDDLDSVSFCVLATDEEFECDIALQIHFTLIQSFCFDNDISIVRVSDMQRLAEIVGDKAEQLEDAHCVLITVCRPQLNHVLLLLSFTYEISVIYIVLKNLCWNNVSVLRWIIVFQSF